MDIYGVILAGGLSSRFGSCKSQLHVASESVLKNMYALLSRHCVKVRVSCRDEKKIYGYPHIYDEYVCYAPMAGVYSALVYYQGPVLVLSCDLPFINDVVIQELIATRNAVVQEREDVLMTTYRKEGTHFIESLVAIYEYEACTVLRTALEQERYSLMKAIPEEKRHHIITKDEESFFNVNYPHDIQQAEKIYFAKKYSADV